MGSFWFGAILAQKVGTFHHQKAWARSILEDAERVRRLGTDGRWQHEVPYKEELELLRHSSDLRFEDVLMGQAYNAEKSGDWANHLEQIHGKWQARRLDKCEGEVEQEDEGNVKDILRKRHGLLDSDHRASRRSGSGLKTTFCGSLLDTGRNSAIRGVRLAAHPNRVLESTNRREVVFFERTLDCKECATTRSMR